MTTRGLAKLVGLGVILAIAAVTTRLPAQPARLLVLTHSAGYEHDVVRRPGPGRQAIAEQVIGELGRQSGAFAATFLQSEPELRALTSAALRDFHAFLFFTTGSLPLTASVRAELFARVRSGSGFVGVHSASDTWYDVPEYGEMLGGVFDGHPWHERVTIVVEDPKHPATAHLGAAFPINDEIYQFRNWSRQGVHVLLRLDARSIDVQRGKRSDEDYALAWTRRHGEGRVFYTALGHRSEVWADERFRQHLLGGIQWALGLR
jgi:type 1 glutamine amidotransferase